MAFMARIWMIIMALAVLAACALDDPSTARTYVARWAWPGANTFFMSRRTCSVAVFRLKAGILRPQAPRVYDLRQGVAMLRQGRAVAFADTSVTPDALAQAVMSADLHAGLGLLASVMEPRACMTDEVAQGVHRLLTARGLVTVYDPAQRAVMLLDFGSRHAIVMRRAP